MIRKIHRAKYILPESDLLLQNAAIHISDPGRISRVEPWHGPPPALETEVTDWGNAVILPGFINCHAHLELTRLHNELSEFSCFTDWLRQLIEKRRHWTEQDFIESTRAGARMALSSGTTLVGDISAGGFSRKALATEKLRKVVFEETVGFLPESSPEAITSLEMRLSRSEADELGSPGVSPHAPYSVSPELYRRTAALARARDIPLATHVAETKAELEFVHSGTGEFRRFLDRLGVVPPAWTPPAMSPVGYLDSLGVLESPALLIHCNYLEEESMAKILSSRSSVIYCPRSHAFFGHPKHPVRKLLDLGVNVALGTDSLASNDSLSLLDEVRFLARVRKDLKAEEIFRMATLNGAAALNLGMALGRLRRGYWADMAVLRLPEEIPARNLAGQILEGAGECIATVVRGEVVWQRR